MAAARRSPPVYVLNRYLLVGDSHAGNKEGEGWAAPNVQVNNGNLTGKAEEGWTEIEIARREAYGCGGNMREALNGLSLCVCLGDDPVVTSALGLRVSRDAHGRLISELELDAALYYDDEEEKPEIWAEIMMQQQELLIIALFVECRSRSLSCYLVYDHSDASLSMISWAPDSLGVFGMFRPVPKRNASDDGGGGAFELFLLASESDDDLLPLASDMDEPPPFLCVFSPVTAAAKANPTCAWETKKTSRWDVPVSVFERFRTDATFSFRGKGFWADLSQALVYCDLHHAATDDDDSAVNFDCIELPDECQLDLEEMLDCDLPMKVSRTIACVGDSIWFVCVHCGRRHADDSVTMWTLELPGPGRGQWKNEARFPVRELWRFDGFKEAGLPEATVEFPLLTADGALCLVVTGQFLGYSSSDVSDVDHICTFDVRSKRLLWHGTVHDHFFNETVACPPEFFQRKQHGSHKRKFDELHPAAGGAGFAARE